MIDLGFLKDQSFAVLGLGKSGLATALALQAGGAKVLAWDDSPAAREAAAKDGVNLVDLTQTDLAGVAALVVAPGIPHTHPAPHPVAARAKAAGLKLIGDVELFWRALKAKASDGPMPALIGITGSNGKSTTTALIGHILAEAGLPTVVGGNLGTPVLSFPHLGADGVYVLELSSYQLELLDETRLDVAILVNVSPDHLDRHGGMDGYVAAKARIFEGAPFAAVSLDDADSRELFGRAVADGARVLGVSVGHGVGGGICVLAGELYDARETPPRSVVDLRLAHTLPGAHNFQNAAMAYAACVLLGEARPASAVAPETVATGILGFPGLAHRQQLVAQAGGLRFVNDSKATNADAAAKALASYDDIYWIAGGKPKDDDLAILDLFLPRVRRAFLIGEATERFAAWIGDRLPFERSGDLATATRAAFDATQRDGAAQATILLSPACASFDQFRSFEHRGETFAELARKLAAEAAG